MTPRLEMYVDLVFKKWWTQDTGKTNDAGTLTGRGFFGDYRVTVEQAGGKVSGQFTLSPDQKTWVLTL